MCFFFPHIIQSKKKKLQCQAIVASIATFAHQNKRCGEIAVHCGAAEGRQEKTSLKSASCIYKKKMAVSDKQRRKNTKLLT